MIDWLSKLDIATAAMLGVIYLVPPVGDKFVVQFGQAKIMGTA